MNGIRSPSWKIVVESETYPASFAPMSDQCALAPLNPRSTPSITIGAKTVTSLRWLPQIAESLTIQMSPGAKASAPLSASAALIVPTRLPRKNGRPGAWPRRSPWAS